MWANLVMSMFGTSENALKHVSSIVSSSAVCASSKASMSSVWMDDTTEAFLIEAARGVASIFPGIEVSSSQILKGADSILSCREGVRSSLRVVISCAEALFVDGSAEANSVTNGELLPLFQLISSAGSFSTAGLLGVMLSSAISRSKDRECNAEEGDRLELRAEGVNGVNGMIGCWMTRVSTIAWVIVCTSEGCLQDKVIMGGVGALLCL